MVVLLLKNRGPTAESLERANEGGGKPEQTSPRGFFYRNSSQREGIPVVEHRGMGEQRSDAAAVGPAPAVTAVRGAGPAPAVRDVRADDNNNAHEVLLGAGQGEALPDVVDLTSEPEIEILSSTVHATPPRVKKRMKTTHVQVHPVLEELQQGQSSPENAPTCGICIERMGANTNKPMMAGNCGYVAATVGAGSGVDNSNSACITIR